MIDKDIVIIGEFELNENDNIDVDSYNKCLQRIVYDESFVNFKNIIMFINESIKLGKCKFNGSVDDVIVKEDMYV